jgi:ketosteroid isomerase-like protein
MFRAFVAHRVRVTWSHLAGRDYRYVLEQFAPTFAHSFAGNHALGGERHRRETQRAWFERLFHLFPDAEFTLDDVLVRGWPWRTRAVALLRVRASIADQPYENEFAQTLDLRWGRITRIHNLEDTQKLVAALGQLAASGIDEARASPITDDAPPAAAE